MCMCECMVLFCGCMHANTLVLNIVWCYVVVCVFACVIGGNGRTRVCAFLCNSLIRISLISPLTRDVQLCVCSFLGVLWGNGRVCARVCAFLCN